MAGTIGRSSMGKHTHREVREVCAYGVHCAGKLHLI
jgi:hypothetical protein